MSEKPVLGGDWDAVLQDALDEAAAGGLFDFVERERLAAEAGQGPQVYPRRQEVFNAFRLTPFEAVRVVILGQDPYHGPGQAHGLCFSVPFGVSFPPSLRNIFKELESDLGIPCPIGGDLSGWAEQGVLLLNTTLTVRDGEPGSHAGRGWETFTDAAIRRLNAGRDGLIFVLWGAHAQKKLPLIDPKRHRILLSAHPSPLSAYRGFFGSRPFSAIDEHLRERGQAPIRWD